MKNFHSATIERVAAELSSDTARTPRAIETRLQFELSRSSIRDVLAILVRAGRAIEEGDITQKRYRLKEEDGCGASHDHRAECDRYMKGGGVRRAFVTIIEPGKIPSGKGPFLTRAHLDRFVREAIAHRPEPDTHIVVAELTWDDQLWVECGREMAAIDASLDGGDIPKQLNTHRPEGS
jgi:hypothetical protein